MPNEPQDIVVEARELASYTDGLAAGLQSPTLSRVSLTLRQLCDEVERLRSQQAINLCGDVAHCATCAEAKDFKP